MESDIKIGEKYYTITTDDNYLNAMGSEFEPHMVELFRTLIKPDDVVADIGANIGLTALLFSSLARKVYAFEPSLSTYRILSENLHRAKTNNVEAINLGLGHKAEALSITFARNNRSGGYISDKIRPETGHVTEEIKIDTIDHYFKSRSDCPTFLKIDVEGFEQNVIKGGGRFLAKHTPTAVMEMNHFCLDVLQRITLPDFLDFMRSFFPYLYAVDTDNSTIIDLHNADQAYMVMHEHVVKHRFPNIVGGFEPKIKLKLDELATVRTSQKLFITPEVIKPYGKITTQAIPATVRIGATFEVAVNVTNESEETWHGRGNKPVLLSYHWQRSDGSFLVFDGLRTELTADELVPGREVKQKMSVVAPSEGGEFSFVLTLVQEGVSWFEDRGFEPHAINVCVE